MNRNNGIIPVKVLDRGEKMQFIQTENFERISKKTIVYERERKTKDSNKLLKLIVKNYSPKTRNSIS